MKDLVRQEIVTAAHTMVIKVGTRVVTRPDGILNIARITRLAEEISQLEDLGHHVVLVSSGAVGAGMGQLGLTQRPTDVADLQAVAAVGQARLIEAYDQTLRKHGRSAAQVLLTAQDLDDRTRYLNVRNTIRALLDYRAVPIINENDTVAVDELVMTFGDNDRLAALLTTLLQAPLLIMLSDVDGLYDGDPSDSSSRRIAVVEQLDDRTYSFVRDGRSAMSKGGMASKLDAARIVTRAGENVIIANGHEPDVLQAIAAGQPVGTLVLAQGKTICSRKRWIGFSARLCGHLIVDAGARQAIGYQGGSLLAIGVVGVGGNFRKGDLVALRDPAGQEFARGLTNYRSDDLERIKGLRSDRIAQVLGHRPYEEVIHRDNLTVL